MARSIPGHRKGCAIYAAITMSNHLKSQVRHLEILANFVVCPALGELEPRHWPATETRRHLTMKFGFLFMLGSNKSLRDAGLDVSLFYVKYIPSSLDLLLGLGGFPARAPGAQLLRVVISNGTALVPCRSHATCLGGSNSRMPRIAISVLLVGWVHSKQRHATANARDLGGPKTRNADEDGKLDRPN